MTFFSKKHDAESDAFAGFMKGDQYLSAEKEYAVFAVVQSAAPMISYEKLEAIADRTKAVWLTELLDSCKANKRKLRKTEHKLASSRGNLFYVASACTAHLVHIVLIGSTAKCPMSLSTATSSK